MLVGYAYFVFRPNDQLRQRLANAPDGVAGALEDAVVMPVPLGGDVSLDDVSAAKVLFVANVVAATLPAADVLSLFGSLAPSVESFDAWWTCDVVSADLDLADVVADLRAAGMLDSLRPLVGRLLLHVK